MELPLDLMLVLALAGGVIGFAVWRGSKPEVYGAAIIGFNMCVDLIVLKIVGAWDFSTFSSTRFSIDLLEFGLLFALALTANRVWPIISAAAQLVAVGGSLAVLRSEEGLQVTYWAMTQLPLFGQFAALAFGTMLHTKRRETLGPYRDWRVAHSFQH